MAGLPEVLMARSEGASNKAMGTHTRGRRTKRGREGFVQSGSGCEALITCREPMRLALRAKIHRLDLLNRDGSC